MAEAWIIDACRTPRGIGKKGKGSLADQHPQHLGATVLKAIVERNGVNTAEVGDVIFGTSSQRGRQSGDLARMAALEAGFDIRSSGVTLDRFCGSGITSVNLAAMNVMSGSEDLVIADLDVGPLFVFAMALSLAYLYTGNIIVPMVMHFLFNSASLAMLFAIRTLAPQLAQ